MLTTRRRSMNELALFAGAGGGILGGHLLGWRTRCAVELDPYARKVLLARQRDGMLPRFPIWDDVRTFDGKPWRGHIDVLSAGWPCQDVSVAGSGKGLEGERSGLWVEVARILGEIRPRYFFGENSPALLANRGWRRVFGDLHALGYDVRWGVIGAHHAGAPHKRNRIWIVATHSNSDGLVPKSGDCLSNDHGHIAPSQKGRSNKPDRISCDNRKQVTNWWKTQSSVCRVSNGVAHRMDRLRAIGNGQVPAVAALAWRMLSL